MRDGGIHNRTLSTKEFKLLLEQFSGENLDEIFSYYFKNFKEPPHVLVSSTVQPSNSKYIH